MLFSSFFQDASASVSCLFLHTRVLFTSFFPDKKKRGCREIDRPAQPVRRIFLQFPSGIRQQNPLFVPRSRDELKLHKAFLCQSRNRRVDCLFRQKARIADLLLRQNRLFIRRKIEDRTHPRNRTALPHPAPESYHGRNSVCLTSP